MNLSLAYWYNFKQKSDDGEEEREKYQWRGHKKFTADSAKKLYFDLVWENWDSIMQTVPVLTLDITILRLLRLFAFTWLYCGKIE